MDSRRIENAYRHFGHDITDEDHVFEAGLGFAVRTGKGDFIGRDAVGRKREAGLHRRMVQLRLTDPEPLLFHNEPILRDGRIVGFLTSGNHGHAVGGAIGLGYVPCRPDETPAEMLASDYAIDVAGRMVSAGAGLAPVYDPKSERVRGRAVIGAGRRPGQSPGGSWGSVDRRRSRTVHRNGERQG